MRLTYVPQVRALFTGLKIFLVWIYCSPKIPNFPKTMLLQTMLFQCKSIKSHETFRGGEMFYIRFKENIKQ